MGSLSDKINNSMKYEGANIGVLDVREFIRLLKKKFCTGKKADTIVKEFCTKGDYFYCKSCEKIDEAAGPALVGGKDDAE